MKIITILALLTLSISASANSKISKQLAKDLASKDTVDLYLLLNNQKQVQSKASNNRIEKIQHIVTQLKYNSHDSISSFGSQGAITVDGSNRIKPDMVAPGSAINSANLGGGFSFSSGTSMAAPHVVGVAALMISAKHGRKTKNT